MQTVQLDEDLKAIAIGAASKVEANMDKFAFNMALEDIWTVVRRANKYIDETMPWVLAKDEKDKPRLDNVLHNLAEAIRIVSVLIEPFMHTTSGKIRKQLGLWFAEPVWADAFTFEMMNGEQVKKGDPIFPRLDIEKELEELEALQHAGKEKNIPLELKPEIEFDDFDKIDFRVGTILSAEKHPKADKLLVFQVKMGTETASDHLRRSQALYTGRMRGQKSSRSCQPEAEKAERTGIQRHDHVCGRCEGRQRDPGLRQPGSRRWESGELRCCSIPMHT